jgi:ABC-type multidrug transport system fused ATPase/permease subunit
MINAFRRFGDDGDDVLEQYDFNNFNKWNSTWILFFAVGIISTATYIALRPLESALIHNKTITREDTNPIAEELENLIKIPDLRDEHSENLDQTEGVKATSGHVITFQNLSYTVRASHTHQNLHILKNISASMSPCEVCVLMGASGSG